MTQDLGVSRGVFSLLRSGEILVGAFMAPAVGQLVDRYSGRWLIALGAVATGVGFLLLSQVTAFWHFFILRVVFITVGAGFMCHLVINVAISRWFIRKRGRAIAIATMGQGLSKVSIPLVAASLFVWLGWRQTWGVFGILTILLVVGPALKFIRSRPEEMGLHPDGAPEPYPVGSSKGSETSSSKTKHHAVATDMEWSRREVLRTKAFWLLVITFSIANVGITGLNLHVFSYITDIGHSAIVAATVLSIIAFTQLSSTLFWGFLSERIDLRKATLLMFLIQALGITLVILTIQLSWVYAGFFIYGIGLGGSQVLQEVMWAHYFGRISLGKVRGLSILVTHAFAAVGPPFFGFLFDLTNSYLASFITFTITLLISARVIYEAARARGIGKELPSELFVTQRGDKKYSP